MSAITLGLSSSGLPSALNILLHGDGFEVIWIHAIPASTRMVYVITFGYGTLVDLIAKSVGKILLALILQSAVPH